MLTNYERETIITFNEAETDCEVYTYNQKLIHKLKKRCESHPNLYRKVSEDKFGGCTFSFPKTLLTISPRVPMICVKCTVKWQSRTDWAEMGANPKITVGIERSANCSGYPTSNK